MLIMYFPSLWVFLFTAIAHAQYKLGPNITDLALTYQFNDGLNFFNFDPQAKALLNGPKKVTALFPLNFPLNSYEPRLLASPDSASKTETLIGLRNLTLSLELLRFIVLDGVYSSADLFGGLKFLPTFLVDPRTYRLSQPAKVGIFYDETSFYVRTGVNFTSDIVIRDIPFSNGLIHLVSFPFSPLKNISTTGIILEIQSLQRIVAPSAAPIVEELTDVTFFAPSNKVPSRKIRNWNDYFFAGNVAYSTTLTGGKVFRARSGKKLVITHDKMGRKRVNGVKIISTDILTSNGVVHIIDRAL